MDERPQRAAANAGWATDTRPFLVVIVLLLLAVIGWTVALEPAVFTASSIASIGVLSVLHAVLHWCVLRPQAPIRPIVVGSYLALQAAVVAALGVLVHSPEVTLGLCLGLVGEAHSIRPRIWSFVTSTLLVSIPIVHLWLLGRASSIALLIVGCCTLMVVFYVEMFQRQARARADAQAALRDLYSAHARLADYATQVQELTLAAERQRMARDLHDTLTQGLAGLILQLDALSVRFDRGDQDKSRAILKQARETARATLAEAREVISDLRAAGTEPLPEAIRAEALRFEHATGIPCELSIEERLPLAPEHEIHALRFVSEGLANCARHARATRVRLVANRQELRIVLEISDDGVGFCLAEVENQAGRYGLLGLRERARLAGGDLLVESIPGTGTRLRLELAALKGDNG